MPRTHGSELGRSKLAASAALVLAFLSALVAIAPSAFAHHQTLGAEVSCLASDGTWSVTWSTTNSESNKTMDIEDVDLDVDVNTYGLWLGATHPGDPTLAPDPVPNSGTATGVSNFAADVARARLTVRVDWVGASSDTDSLIVPRPTVPCVTFFDVVPQKHWDFGGDDVPADGSASITIDAGESGSKTWTFDTSGGFVGDDTPLNLPTGTPYTVSEPVFTNPEGWVCQESQVRPLILQVPVEDLVVEHVYNTCDEEQPEPLVEVEVKRTVDCVADVVIITTTTTTTEYVWNAELREWELGEPVAVDVVTTEAYDGEPCDGPTTTTSTSTPGTSSTSLPSTTTVEGAVGGIGAEAPATVASAQLPRTGGPSASTASLGIVMLLGGAVLVALGRRRLRVIGSDPR